MSNFFFCFQKSSAADASESKGLKAYGNTFSGDTLPVFCLNVHLGTICITYMWTVSTGESVQMHWLPQTFTVRNCFKSSKSLDTSQMYFMRIQSNNAVNLSLIQQICSRRL